MYLIHLTYQTSWASQAVLVIKNLLTNAGDTRDAGSIPGSGRNPGGGNDNLLQYSCLENSMDRGAWWAAVLFMRPSMDFPGGSSGKESACQFRRHKRCRFNPWVRKIPWSRKWQPSPVPVPGKCRGQRSLVGSILYSMAIKQTYARLNSNV